MHTTHRGAKIEHLPLKAAPSIKNNWPAYHGIKKHGRNLTEIGEAAEIRPSDYVGVINYVLDGDYFEEKKQKQQLRVGNSGSSGIFRRLGSSILNTMDFAGQKLAGLFGITDGRYEEYYEDCEAYEHDIAMTEVYVGAAVAAEELKLALS
ncbi:hypothetical protein HK100_012376 [Physocladia obscura]|uniref:Uncharacterized protein n=1 Tax=Physocladia obscura TaxID=109957 RepID=A0AAD5T8J0_9FUNG|nr:hypothetical protein HK100_012376 [Physocladia obscura]